MCSFNNFRFKHIMSYFIDDQYILYILLNKSKSKYLQLIEKFILLSQKREVYKFLYSGKI